MFSLSTFSLMMFCYLKKNSESAAEPTSSYVTVVKEGISLYAVDMGLGSLGSASQTEQSPLVQPGDNNSLLAQLVPMATELESGLTS